MRNELSVEDLEIIRKYTVEDPKPLSFIANLIGCGVQTVSNYRKKMGVSWKHKCPNCGKEFETTSTVQRFCCKKCYMDYRIHGELERKCPVCNKRFKTTKSQQKYCSPECREKNYTKKLHKDYLGRWKNSEKVIRKCDNCGKEFTVPKASRKRYCSKECRYKLLEELNKICPNCGKKFRANSRERIYCSMKCFNEYKKKHWEKKRANPHIRICPECGSEFKTFHHTKKFCSEECKRNYHLIKHKPKICPICGQSFIPKKSTKRFCSPKCRMKDQQKRDKEYRQKNRPKDVIKKCIFCGKEFKIAWGKGGFRKRKFCSRKCCQLYHERKRYRPKVEGLRSFLRRKYPTILTEYFSETIWKHRKSKNV